MANQVEIVVVAKDNTKGTFDAIRARAKTSGEGAGKDYGDGVGKGLGDTAPVIQAKGIAPIKALIAAQQGFVKSTNDVDVAQKKFGEDSQQAANAHLNLAKAALTLDSATQKFGGSLKEVTPELEGMFKAAGLGEDAIKDIGKVFERGVGDFGKIGEKAGKDAASGIASGVGNLAKEGEKVGASFGSSIASSASGILEATGPGGAIIGAAIIGIAAFAAPIVAGVLAAAVIGGTAIGGVVGGIILAAKDPRITAAATQLGGTVSRALTIDAKPFIQPVLDAVKTAQNSFFTLAPTIQGIFAESAQYVAPLTSALTGAFETLAPSLENLVSSAGPTIDALGAEIGNTAGVIAQFLDDMANHGTEAAEALRVAFFIVNSAIGAVDLALTGLLATFGFLADAYVFGPQVKEQYDNYKKQAEDSAEANAKVKGSLSDVATQADDTEVSINNLADALKAQADPVFALIKAQEKLRDAQGEYSKAVATSGKNSDAAKDALITLAKAAVNVGSTSSALAGKFNGQLSPAMIATFKAAGLSDSAIAAIGKTAQSSGKQLQNFSKTYTAHVVTIFTQIGKPSSQTTLSANTYKGLATGGVRGASYGGAQGGLTLVGENGPELVNLPLGSMVTPSGQSMQKLKDAAQSNGSSSPQEITLNISGGADTAFATMLQKMFNSGLIRVNSRFVTS